MSKVIRILAGGEGRIGFLRLLKLSQKLVMSMGPESGKGFDFYSNRINIDDDESILSIWEFTEQDKWKTLLEPFIKETNGAILVFEVYRKSLYKYLENWVKLFRKYDSNLPIILVGTIPDLKDITRENEILISNLVKELNICDYIKVVPQSGGNLDSVFESLLNKIFKDISNEEDRDKGIFSFSKDEIGKYLNKNYISSTNTPCEYKINQYFKLIFENGKSNIYVNNKKFIQCKYLLLVNPQEQEMQEIVQSIDEAQKYLSRKTEGRTTLLDFGITAEQEFWGHCSV